MPLTDRQWAALAPFVARHSAGRPIQDARLRLAAIFWLAAQPNGPRTDYPSPYATLYDLPGRAARWADLPNPDLSEDVQALSFTVTKPMKEGRLHDIPGGFFARCAALLRIAAGRTRIPWYLAPL